MKRAIIVLRAVGVPMALRAGTRARTWDSCSELLPMLGIPRTHRTPCEEYHQELGRPLGGPRPVADLHPLGVAPSMHPSIAPRIA